jgi:hypothetical protein
VADELVRVCRSGGTIGLLSWTPEGMIGALFRTIGPFAPPPPPGAQPPSLSGSEEHVREQLFGERVEWAALERGVLEVTAFERPRDFGEHFKAKHGPTIAARANAGRSDREFEFDEALDSFCDEWNRGTPDRRALRDGVPARGGPPSLSRGALITRPSPGATRARRADGRRGSSASRRGRRRSERGRSP